MLRFLLDFTGMKYIERQNGIWWTTLLATLRKDGRCVAHYVKNYYIETWRWKNKSSSSSNMFLQKKLRAVAPNVVESKQPDGPQKRKLAAECARAIRNEIRFGFPVSVSGCRVVAVVVSLIKNFPAKCKFNPIILIANQNFNFLTWTLL